MFIRPAPKNEDEMMVAIFEYIDRLFNIVRPRRVLYMAIDGVVSTIYRLNAQLLCACVSGCISGYIVFCSLKLLCLTNAGS